MDVKNVWINNNNNNNNNNFPCKIRLQYYRSSDIGHRYWIKTSVSLNLQESRRKFLTVLVTEGSAFLTALAIAINIGLRNYFGYYYKFWRV
jgi:hypothetical protein